MLRGLCASFLLVSVVACGGTPTTPTGTSADKAAPPFSAGGRVISHAGQAPIPGATVSILNGSDAGQSTTTDADGKFAFKGLQQSSSIVNVSADGYFDSRAPLTVNQAVTVFLIETGPTIVLTGQVTDAATSSPVSGATVRINGRYQTTADNSGNYSLTGFLDIGASSIVQAFAGGYEWYTRYIRGGSAQSFRLRKIERITAGDSWSVIVGPDDSLCENNLQDPSESAPGSGYNYICRSVRVAAPRDGVMNLEAVSTAGEAHPPLEVEVIAGSHCCSERLDNPTSFQVAAGAEVIVSVEIPEGATASQSFKLTTSMAEQ